MTLQQSSTDDPTSFPTNDHVPSVNQVPPNTSTSPPTTTEHYFAFRTPDTPPFAYFQPVPTPTTASTAPSSSVATPSSTRQSRPFGQPPRNASPPETSRSAALSTASSAPFFAFRPPSEPDPARLSWSRGHPQTRILSPDSTSPNTGLQTHWEHLSPPSSRGTEPPPTPVEKSFDIALVPAPAWPEPQNDDSFLQSSPTPGSSKCVHALVRAYPAHRHSGSYSIPRISASNEKISEHTQEQVIQTTILPLDENPLYIQDLEEDSPYPEVRASVSNTDDPDMPCLTFRMWAVGLTLCLIMNAANMYLYLRSPSPYITAPSTVYASLCPPPSPGFELTPIIFLHSKSILGYAGGKLLAATLPIRSWHIAGYEFSLNPGPFNIKEHALIYMLAGITISTSPVPYGMGAVIVWDKRYMQPLRTGLVAVKGFTVAFPSATNSGA